MLSGIGERCIVGVVGMADLGFKGASAIRDYLAMVVCFGSRGLAGPVWQKREKHIQAFCQCGYMPPCVMERMDRGTVRGHTWPRW